jgi:hypothetical protein
LRPVVGGWSVGAADEADWLAEDPCDEPFAAGAAVALAADLSVPGTVALEAALPAPEAALPAPEAALPAPEAAVVDAATTPAELEDMDDPLLPPSAITSPTISATPATIAPLASQKPLVIQRRRGGRATAAASGANPIATQRSIDRHPAIHRLRERGGHRRTLGRQQQGDLGQVRIPSVNRLARQHRINCVQRGRDLGIDRFVVIKQSHCRPS